LLFTSLAFHYVEFKTDRRLVKVGMQGGDGYF